MLEPHPNAGSIIPLLASYMGEQADQTLSAALQMWKPTIRNLRDFGISPTSGSDRTKALLALLHHAGPHGPAPWTAETHAPPDAFAQASSFSLQVDQFEPDPRNRAAMLNGPQHLIPHWQQAEAVEMDGIWKRGCIKRVRRSDLSSVDKVFQLSLIHI